MDDDGGHGWTVLGVGRVGRRPRRHRLQTTPDDSMASHGSARPAACSVQR